jgi:hypothetical protein
MFHLCLEFTAVCIHYHIHIYVALPFQKPPANMRNIVNMHGQNIADIHKSDILEDKQFCSLPAFCIMMFTVHPITEY